MAFTYDDPNNPNGQSNMAFFNQMTKQASQSGPPIMADETSIMGPPPMVAHKNQEPVTEEASHVAVHTGIAALVAGLAIATPFAWKHLGGKFASKESRDITEKVLETPTAKVNKEVKDKHIKWQEEQAAKAEPKPKPTIKPEEVKTGTVDEMLKPKKEKAPEPKPAPKPKPEPENVHRKVNDQGFYTVATSKHVDEMDADELRNVLKQLVDKKERTRTASDKGHSEEVWQRQMDSIGDDISIVKDRIRNQKKTAPTEQPVVPEANDSIAGRFKSPESFYQAMKDYEDEFEALLDRNLSDSQFDLAVGELKKRYNLDERY